jgi:DNA-directed RNA polymerase specialized sigma24 family protein
MEDLMTTDDEFRAWTAQNRRRLVRTAALLTGGEPETAETVVQATLTRTYLAWPRLRGPEKRQAFARRALVGAATAEMRSANHTPHPDPAVPGGVPTEEVLDEDVLRGRHARRRRRGVVGTRAVAVLAVAVAVGLSVESTVGPAAAVDLVDYTAEQPAGFAIAQVPDGWRVLSSDAGSLTLGDADGSGPAAGASAGRIVASLVGAGALPESSTPRTFTVDGETTLVYETSGTGTGGTLDVYVPADDGGYLSVRLPPELEWDGAVAARFAAGLDVTGAGA